MAANEQMKRRFHLRNWKMASLALAFYDVFAVTFSYFFALWLRFDCQYSEIPEEYLRCWLRFAPIYAGFCLLVFFVLRLYRSVWKYASFSELIRTIGGTILTGVFHTVAMPLLIGHMPISYYLFGAATQFLLVLGVRFAYRFVLLLKSRQKVADGCRVMLIGAGAAGQMLLRDIYSSRELSDHVLCIIDDDASKHGRYIKGIPIVGGRDEILASCQKYAIEKIYVAIPSAGDADKRDILGICKETGCTLKTLPGIYQLVNGEVTVGRMKDVAIEDLLGRKPITVNLDEVFDFIRGRTILVTGGGGSIGSELCRQIASHKPKTLIIFDIYENNAYDIQIELREKYPDLDLVVLIGSVRDSRRINQVFRDYRPDVVYHAAAHKHVPLMEDSPCEAIKDNTIGTYKTAYAAMAHGCKRFVLISTDKAVNPTNVMGASKRLCEMVIQTFDRKIRDGKAREIPLLFTHYAEAEDVDREFGELPEKVVTEFVAVRFGNVLGSNGSVIPLFKRQIAKGGPVTVTHPDIIRYFMTIPEAVSLVLQAGVYAKGGEIFVLDMGEPVKIDALARNLIKLSGYKPDVDIPISYTGLRPGEKLFEEKLMAEEGMKTTPNKLIHIGSPLPFDEDEFLKELGCLMAAAYENDPTIRRKIASIVRTYHVVDGTVPQEGDCAGDCAEPEMAAAVC